MDNNILELIKIVVLVMIAIGLAVIAWEIGEVAHVLEKFPVTITS